MTKSAWIQGVVILIAAFAIAIVANGFASRQRQLLLPGFYPNARRVPPRAPEVTAPPPALTTTETIAPTTTVAATPAEVIPTTTTVATTTTADIRKTTTTAAPPVATATTAPALRPTPPAVVEEDPLKRFPPHPDKAYVEISGEDVAWLHGKGALFLDARRSSVYEQGHIAGARSFSVWESDVDDKVSKLFDERSDPREQNQAIVIYCTGGACEDSHMLAQKLWGVQFNNVYVYRDGYPDWQQRAGAVKTGAQP